MVGYLVPLDASSSARAAFYAALSMITVGGKMRDGDHLYLLCVVEDIPRYGVTTFSLNMLPDLQKEYEKEAALILRRYAQLCKAAKVPATLMTGNSSHIGEMICQVVEKKKIDFLIMGRRGMGKIQRMLVGSTSRYCVDNADCNIFIIKEGHENTIKSEHVLNAEEEEKKKNVDIHDAELHPLENVQLTEAKKS